MYDVVIIGGGPSGLAAGIYLARANYRVVIVEKNHYVRCMEGNTQRQL